MEKENKLMKNFINAINYGKYVAFGLATIFVLVFSLTAIPLFVKMSLVFYVVAFLMMTLDMLFHVFTISDAIKALGDNKNDTYKTLKGEYIAFIIGTIFFAVFSAFTVVVMILY